MPATGARMMREISEKALVVISRRGSNVAMTSPVHKARDLSPDIRTAVEALLGRPLQDDESIAVKAFKGEVVKPAPTGSLREKAFQRLQSRMDNTGRRLCGLPEGELDAAIDEAVETVRHREG